MNEDKELEVKDTCYIFNFLQTTIHVLLPLLRQPLDAILVALQKSHKIFLSLP